METTYRVKSIGFAADGTVKIIVIRERRFGGELLSSDQWGGEITKGTDLTDYMTPCQWGDGKIDPVALLATERDYIAAKWAE